MNAETSRRRAATNMASPGRNALLDAASALMIERDDIDVSLADIAERAQVTPAMVRYYFGSKTGMLMSLLRRGTEANEVALDHLERSNLSPTEKMQHHLAAMIRTMSQKPYLNRLGVELMKQGDATDRRRVVEYYSGVLAFYKNIMSAGQTSGEFEIVDPLMYYISVTGAIEKHFLPGPLGGADGSSAKYNREQLQKLIDFIVPMLMAGLVRK